MTAKKKSTKTTEAPAKAEEKKIKLRRYSPEEKSLIAASKKLKTVAAQFANLQQKLMVLLSDVEGQEAIIEENRIIKE